MLLYIDEKSLCGFVSISLIDVYKEVYICHWGWSALLLIILQFILRFDSNNVFVR